MSKQLELETGALDDDGFEWLRGLGEVKLLDYLERIQDGRIEVTGKLWPHDTTSRKRRFEWLLLDVLDDARGIFSMDYKKLAEFIREHEERSS